MRIVPQIPPRRCEVLERRFGRVACAVESQEPGKVGAEMGLIMNIATL
jgi:hypothetical protein